MPPGPRDRYPPDPEADPHPKMTSEAAGTHPTGMHSCFLDRCVPYFFMLYNILFHALFAHTGSSGFPGSFIRQ